MDAAQPPRHTDSHLVESENRNEKAMAGIVRADSNARCIINQHLLQVSVLLIVFVCSLYISGVLIRFLELDGVRRSERPADEL